MNVRSQLGLLFETQKEVAHSSLIITWDDGFRQSMVSVASCHSYDEMGLWQAVFWPCSEQELTMGRKKFTSSYKNEEDRKRRSGEMAKWRNGP
jgi:hypothetical protein